GDRVPPPPRPRAALSPAPAGGRRPLRGHLVGVCRAARAGARGGAGDPGAGRPRRVVHLSRAVARRRPLPPARRHLHGLLRQRAHAGGDERRPLAHHRPVPGRVAGRGRRSAGAGRGRAGRSRAPRLGRRGDRRARPARGGRAGDGGEGGELAPAAATRMDAGARAHGRRPPHRRTHFPM
ncbi:MAG: hypothetical protein AVDCRST_MAG68-594, partial [uncultured Gemmatimonadetes bacterium]